MLPRLVQLMYELLKLYDKLTWNKPDEASLLKFLVEEKGFSEKRVISGLKRIEVKRTIYKYFKNKDTKGL